ncbi:MAG: ABC transporter ATP-binding protein [Aerococcus sp.]|nr:ABC transporter ATP-binding protein [Aerococcus sp.]
MRTLTFTNLTKRREHFTLRDISFSARPGEIIALVGHNGAGKTTLLNLIAGITPPDSGTRPAIDAGALGFMFDTSLLIDSLTIDEYRAIFRRIYPTWSTSDFNTAIERYQLPTTQPINEFSRGMLVQLNMSILLAHQPEYLLLDEMTSGLDPFIREQLLTDIKQYVKKKSAIAIFSTHILEDIPHVADQLLVLEHGTIAGRKMLDETETTATIKDFIKESSDHNDWLND